ncbi:bifunctional diguanylate cyclase/phosphodiesterase [Alkalihalobacillus sp. AL-G]|uniref:putative bifunctional diguanylate cyclase/phosphodiesterase n=1 Tax=Alkalihalobacillus sp. AL-G TaxID=2926399 RepID=UPI00272BC395|nr:EAL domain-containing protein [Alkalihalobacillus sp. AL-G]WLD94804.1 EAL domain-containing protein [Alkalihalobacillus sp. AL-G]
MLMSRFSIGVISSVFLLYSIYFLEWVSTAQFLLIAILVFGVLFLISIGLVLRSLNIHSSLTKVLSSFVFASIICLGVAEISRYLFQESYTQIKFLSDGFWIGYVIFITVGLLYVLFKVSTKFDYAFLLFDLHISVVVFGAITLVTYMSTAKDVSLVYGILYPLSDLFVLFVLASMLIVHEKPLNRNLLIGLFWGMTVNLLTDVMLVVNSLDGELERILYLPLYGFGMYLMAASFKTEQKAVPHRYLQTFYITYGRWELIRPLIQYTGVFVLLYECIFIYKNNNILFGGLIITLILVICRDLLGIVQNQSLVNRLKLFNQHLEKKIGERTRELTVSHHELEEAFKQIDYIARHDTFTQLPNRRYLEQMIGCKLIDASRTRSMVALMFIDIDRLKHINDTLGHSIGDALILEFVDRLKEVLPRDVFMARHGGDEFAVVVDELYYEEEIEQIAKQVLSTTDSPFRIHGRDLSITMSIGIALYPENGETVEDLMKNADLAMYKAKDEHQSHMVYYYPEMDYQLAGRMALLTDLHTAIKRNEFEIHYQPQFNIKNGGMSGVEALVRWHHPERGLIAPGEFIPLAEEFDLIIPIDDLVMETSILQFQKWEEQGFAPPRLSVNLCPQQFMVGNLVSKISKLLAQTSFPPEKLVIEITENIAMIEKDLLISQLRELYGMGIQISIDDFGTGYSSLSYVKNYPLNQLKIARPFIMDVPANLNDIAMVKAIIDLSHHFKLTVLVEGVETEEQLSFLKTVQCEEVQGFYFSTPLSAIELEQKYLANHLRDEVKTVNAD